jgi:hypothetical protein
LNRAILTPATMQRIERNIGAQILKPLGKICASVQLNHLKSFAPQSGSAFAPADKRDFALGGKPPH